MIAELTIRRDDGTIVMTTAVNVRAKFVWLSPAGFADERGEPYTGFSFEPVESLVHSAPPAHDDAR